jgi:hypothetical protein
MPSKSKAQHNLMEGVAHNAAFAKKVGIPQSVGRDFATADKGKKFSKGGANAQPKQQSINQPKTHHGEQALFKKGGQIMAKSTDVGNSKSMGKVQTAAPSRDGVASKGKTKGTQIVMAGNKGMKKGGMAKAKK